MTVGAPTCLSGRGARSREPVHAVPASRRRLRGFTLPEMVFTMVILAILAKFAMMKLVTPGTMTVHAQAHAAADLVRRAQSLAVVRGQRMGVSVTTSGANGRLAIDCTTGTTPCNTDSSLTLTQGVSLGGASSVYFNTLGQPVSSAGVPLTANSSFTVGYTAGASAPVNTYTITVAAQTGRVSIAP